MSYLGVGYCGGQTAGSRRFERLPSATDPVPPTTEHRGVFAQEYDFELTQNDDKNLNGALYKSEPIEKD